MRSHTFFNIKLTIDLPEQTTPLQLQIKGTIPSWVQGVLYRTGPGRYNIKRKDNSVFTIQHWFDGLGQTHRFEITSAGVTYRSRNTTTDLEDHISNPANKVPMTFGQRGDPCESLFKKFFTAFTAYQATVPDGHASNMNVSVTLSADFPGVTHQNKGSKGPANLVVKTDANQLQSLDPETLEPLETFTYGRLHKELSGPLAAAHSCRDSETGEVFNYNLDFGPRGPTYKVFKVSEAGKVDILATIRGVPGSYIHSMALTSRYAVFCIWNCDYAQGGLKLLTSQSLMDAMKPPQPNDRDALFYVIDRKGAGVVSKFTADPFFCFHVINAFDDGDNVVVDLCAFDDWSILNTLTVQQIKTYDPAKALTHGQFRRYRMNTQAKGKITPQTLDQQHSLELPTVHPSLYNKKYNFTYGIHNTAKFKTNFTDSLIKVDVKESLDGRDGVKLWQQHGCTPSEPIFVPSPEGKKEDDGVVLSVVLDGFKGESFLLVLDAYSMTELARAEMPKHVVGFGFHGIYV